MISITKVPFRLLVLFIALAFGVTAGAIPSGKRKDKEKDKSNSPQTQQQTVSGKIDLNTASEKELDSLPGVGPATVKKIVSNRPYSAVDDLKKAGVAQAQIEQIRSLVTVSSGSAGATASQETSIPSSTTPQSASSRSAQPASSLPQSDNPTAAPPAGSGMVWVNLDSEIYHYEGDRWYGKTKHGKYMSEADAQRAGYRAAKTGKGKE